MKIGITEIPDDFLIADGKERWWLIDIPTNSMPPRIRIPLFESMSPVLVNANELDRTQARRVAIYEKIRCRGKYDEYEYHGDDYV